MNVDYLIIALNLAVLGFVWHMNRDMHREIADLRERMARLEGAMGVLSGNVQTLMQALVGQEKTP